MSNETKDTPQLVASLVTRCVVHVQNKLGIELDFKSETLSLLDYFIRDVLEDEGGGFTPPIGDPRRAHVIHLLAPTIGAYFGETLCRLFPCRWRLKSQEPKEWMIEFKHVPLRLSPVGVAAEAIAEENLETWVSAIATSPEHTEALVERLEVAPPVPEDEFFSIATRFEVLQIAQEYLHARKQSRVPAPPDSFSPNDYDRFFKD